MTKSSIPVLEERFLQPPNWRWHSFVRDGRKIRFGSVHPKGSIPDAVVVCLPGLSEFGEKYFEVARDLVARNCAFWVIDWMGQGRSGRYLKNPHKRHSGGFKKDVADLHDWIMGYIKHSSVHPDKGRIPMAMLAHSMGGHIGLHYLKTYPDMFECAGFSAPMVDLKVFEKLPLDVWITGAASVLAPRAYVAGGGNWRASMRPDPQNDPLTSDPVRAAVHNAWCLADPQLQVGSVTWRWLHEAALSSARLYWALNGIKTPCLLALAGQENLVDNGAIRRAAREMTDARLLEFAESRHEILMERDEIRTAFLDAFYGLIKETIIDRPETLKPF